MLDLHSAPFPDSGAPASTRELLLLARRGDAWGLAAARAAAGAGFEVERCDDADGTLGRIDAGERNRVEAVLIVARALAASPPESARALSRRTEEAELPVVLLAEPGAPPGGPLAHLEHVTVVETPPSERVLAAVLCGARRERDSRRRLRRLAAELRDAGRREQELLARVGHELRNPLGAITSALGLIEEARSAGEEAAAAADDRYRELICRQVDCLRRAVDGLLTVGEAANDGDDDEEDRAAGDERRTTTEALPVLLVEDDADGRQALGELLRMWGYDVEMAADGEEGVAKAGRRAPRVALVDIGLPGIDGYEVARRLREALPDAPPLLVAMTGFGQPEDRRRALDAGFDLHLVKPVQPRKLSALLAEACGG